MKQKWKSSQENPPWASQKHPHLVLHSQNVLCLLIALEWAWAWFCNEIYSTIPKSKIFWHVTQALMIWHLLKVHPRAISVNTSSWSSSINSFIIRLFHRNGSVVRRRWLRLTRATQAVGAIRIHIWSRELHHASQSSLTDGDFPTRYTSFWTSGWNLADEASCFNERRKVPNRH